MSIKWPDILRHKNSNFALVDIEDVRGGCTPVANETERNNIPIDKRKLRMIVSYNDGSQEVTKKYLGTDVDDFNWINNSNWVDLVGGGGVSYTFANGIYNDAGTVKLGDNPIIEDTILDVGETLLFAVRTDTVTAGAENWRSYDERVSGEDEVSKPSIKRYIEETVAGEEIGYEITDNGILVFNEYNGKAIYYLADYSTFFDSEDRAVPDVGWVNTKISEVTFVISAATSDVESDLSAGTDKAVFFMPYNMELSEVFAGLGTVCSGSTFITDVNLNGTSILSTKISIDAGESTSLTAATPPVISTSTLTKGGKITVDFDQVGAVDTGKAHTIYLRGTIS
jgi:hypothetical protein